MPFNLFYLYKNNEPSYKEVLTEEEYEMLAQAIHIQNSQYDESRHTTEENNTWFSLVAKISDLES